MVTVRTEPGHPTGYQLTGSYGPMSRWAFPPLPQVAVTRRRTTFRRGGPIVTWPTFSVDGLRAYVALCERSAR